MSFLLGCTSIITMTTTGTECLSSTNVLIIVSSISLVLLVVAGIVSIILVLVVIRQNNKIQLCH